MMDASISPERTPKRRSTPQRRAILEYLRGVTSHPSASVLYEEIRQKIPNISLGTVYRTLGVLKDEGLIQELAYENYSRYDANTCQHCHVVCASCGKVADAEVAPELGDITAAARVPGFKVVGHRLEFVGYCPECHLPSGQAEPGQA